MAINFGSCYSTFKHDGTYGLTYTRITGPRVPLERVARRWLTPPKQLFWAPDAGFDVSRLVNSTHSLTELRQYRGLLIKEAREVDFVYSADVTLDYNGFTLTINGLIVLADRTTHPLLVTASNASAAVQFPSNPVQATA